MVILYVVFLGQFVADGLMEFNIKINTSMSFGELHSITSFKEFVLTKFFILTFAILFILFPLTLLPKLDSLKYSSFLGIIGCLYSIGLVAFNFFDERGKNGYYMNNTVEWVNYHNSPVSFYGNYGEESKYIWYWLSSFSIFAASFNTHFNCPALYGELINRNQQKYINITSISFVIVLLINLIISLCGYFTYGIYVNENILYSLNNLGLTVGIAELIMTLTIIGSYPLLFWNIKISLKNLIFYKHTINHKKIKRKYTNKYTEYFVFFICTVTIWIFSIIAKDVGVLISLIQSLFGNAIVFIFPPIFYLKLLTLDEF